MGDDNLGRNLVSVMKQTNKMDEEGVIFGKNWGKTRFVRYVGQRGARDPVFSHG